LIALQASRFRALLVGPDRETLAARRLDLSFRFPPPKETFGRLRELRSVL
jgi:hypothetical protein